MMKDMLSTQAARRFFRATALMGVAVLMLGLILKLAHAQGGETMIITGGGTLAVVAFSLGGIFPYKATDDNVAKHLSLSPRWNMAMSLSGWSLAALLIGAVFALMHFPGWQMLLLAGAVCLAVSAVGWALYFAAKRDFE